VSNGATTMWNRRLTFAVTAIASVALSFPSQSFADDKPETTDPVKLAIANTTDADFITYVFAEALKKAGYSVNVQPSDYAAHYTAVGTGDIDMLVDAWPTYPELRDEVIATGKAADFGTTGIKAREGWWYPLYVKEKCPGLPDWKALKDEACIKSLATAETAPNARFIDAPADWATNSDKRAAALGLNVTVINSGSSPALAAALQGSIDKKEPVLGWGIDPFWVTARNEGEWVEFPAFEEACLTDPKWGSNPDATHDCGFRRGDVTKIANVAAVKKMPYAAKILTNFKLDAKDVAAAVYAVDVEGDSLEKYAADWAAKNASTVDAWLK
jgi:glycine betaine/proline transport system substrate-binding protein